MAGAACRRAAPPGRWCARDGKPTERLEQLVEAVRAVIADAIEAGGSSLRDYVQANGELGLFQHRFAVYDRGEEVPALRRDDQAHRAVRPLDFCCPAASGEVRANPLCVLRGSFYRPRLPALKRMVAGIVDRLVLRAPQAEPRSTQPLQADFGDTMAYENILVERRGKVGLITPQPAEGAERAVERARRRPERRTRRIRGGCGDRRGRHHRLGKGLLRRRRHQGGGGRRFRLQPIEMTSSREWDRVADVPQAAHRRRRRLCARRRLRACHDVRHHPRRRHGEVRPAGDHARHHPRRRRHAAAARARRQGQGNGDVPDRPADRRGGGGAGRASSRASCRPPG